MYDFFSVIDNEKEYSLVEFKKIMGVVYKKAYKKDIKEKKTKVKKSPNDEKKTKVKKPPSAYNIFVKENMTAVKKQYPELTNQAHMKKIGELWTIKKEENKMDIDVI
jgi:hypothetical protein